VIVDDMITNHIAKTVCKGRGGGGESTARGNARVGHEWKGKMPDRCRADAVQMPGRSGRCQAD
jgi:hypothetical protein